MKPKVDEFKDDKNPTKRFYNLNDIEIPSAGIEGSAPLTGTGGNVSEISDINTVSDLFNLVKTCDKDFNPKPTSLVLNDDGTPKVIYRGGSEDIRVFDRKKSRATNLYGRGFYFTKSQFHAKQYGDAKPYYLDIKSPLKLNENNISKEQMRKFFEAVSKNEDYDIRNYGTTDIGEILGNIYGKGDFETLQDINATAIGDLVEAVELFNKVNGTSYDGFILLTETAVFNPNQIKSVDNGGTFSSWDDNIYYSKSGRGKGEASLNDMVDEAYLKAHVIFNANLSTSINVALKKLINNKGFEELYQKAVNVIRQRDAAKVNQWRQFPEESYHHEYVSLFDADIKLYVQKLHHNPKLSRNSNIFKSIKIL